MKKKSATSLSERIDPRFLLRDFEPSYLFLHRRGELPARVEAALEELAECRACPVMPGQTEESAAIFEWLAREVSPDTYVNIMGQYRPEYEVGQISNDGNPRYGDVNRRPFEEEIQASYQSARRAGLWRFDERRPISPVLP